MAKISPLEASDLISKLLTDRTPLLAFYRTDFVEIKMQGFVDSATKDGITVSVSGPPIDVKRGYISVRHIDRLCDCWYGEKRSLPESWNILGDEYGESVLAIRFLESNERFSLFFTI
jgi:hypothetical protein